MLVSIIKLLQNGLWKDNTFYTFLQTILSTWEEKIQFIEIVFVLCLVLIFIYWITWKKFIKFNKWEFRQIHTNFWDFLEEYWSEILFKFLIWMIIILLVYGRGVGYDILSSILHFFSYDWTNYEWLMFIFWYDKWVIYEWYNWLRWIFILVAFSLTVWHWLSYFIINDGEESLNLKWIPTTHFKSFKNRWISMLVWILLLFSVMPEMFVNWILHIFTDKNIHDYINPSSSISSSINK